MLEIDWSQVTLLSCWLSWFHLNQVLKVTKLTVKTLSIADGLNCCNWTPSVTLIYFFVLSHDQHPTECDKYFFWPHSNTQYYLVFRNHQIRNIEYYSLLRKFETQILFAIEKIRIPNMNRTIRSYYLNTDNKIPNSFQNFGRRQLKSTYLSRTRHCI